MPLVMKDKLRGIFTPNLVPLDARGDINEDEFRQFVFTNPARLHTTLNPDFFKGTVVENAIAKI